MIEPFELTLKNINLTPDEWDEEENEGALIVGGITARIYGELRPGAIIRVEVDSDGDIASIYVEDEEKEIEGYIFHANDDFLPSSLSGRVLTWKDYDCGSVVVVLKEALPDMTFSGE